MLGLVFKILTRIYPSFLGCRVSCRKALWIKPGEPTWQVDLEREKPVPGSWLTVPMELGMRLVPHMASCISAAFLA